MKRSIELDQKILDYEGRPVPTSDDDQSPFTLRKAVIAYCRNAHQLGLTDAEQDEMYMVGISFGDRSASKVILTTREYEAIEKAIKLNRIKRPNGEELPLFGTEIHGAVKKMVAEADIVKEESKK